MAYTAQPAGFLADTIQRIYDYANEPSENPKWTSDKLYPLIRGSYGRVMQDVNGLGQNPLIVRFDVTVTSTQRTYLLPPNIGQIIAFGKVNTTTDEFYECILPQSRLNPSGPGVTFEGPLVRFEPNWGVDETLRVLYIPNGDCALHLGTFLSTDDDVTTTTIPVSTSPSEGYFDRRPNAYLGSMFRLLSCLDDTDVSVSPIGYSYFPVQERPITGVVAETALITVDTELDFDPSADMDGADPFTFTYEIVPFMGDLFQEAISWDVAAIIHGTEARPLEKKDALANRLNQMRMIRSNLSAYNARTGMILRADLVPRWLG